jgi:Conjugal transfer protein TraD
MTGKALARVQQETCRVEAALSRSDQRQLVMQRYRRRHYLIELGSLVEKAGLIDVVGGDPVTLFGAILSLVTQAESADAHKLLPSWHQSGEKSLQRVTAHHDTSSSDWRSAR